MTNNTNPKSQKILDRLELRYDALALIHQLYRVNQGACICENLKQMSPKPPRICSEITTLAENMALSSLLCCSIVGGKQLYDLLNIKGTNQRRLLSKILKNCVQNGLMQSQVVSLGRLGLHNVWYLTRRGYTAAMKFVFPDNPIPLKIPAGSINNIEHALILADIFCDFMVGESLEGTFDNFQKICWYPPHKLMRKYDIRNNYHGGTRYKRLYPDAIIEDKAGKMRFYLEVDRDTKSLGQESDKLKTYLDYFADTAECLSQKYIAIIYSVPTKQRGEAIIKAYKQWIEKNKRDLSEYRIPPLYCFGYRETVPAIRKFLEPEE